MPRLTTVIFLLFILAMSGPGAVLAQALPSPSINGTYPTATNNLGGTATGTNAAHTLASLGLNQGATFDCTGALTGAGFWAAGFSFPSTLELQSQVNNTRLTANFATYTFKFSKTVYGWRFRMDNLDNRDQTTVTFKKGGSVVPISSAELTGSGADITATVTGGKIEATSGGNNDGQEYFDVALLLTRGVDEVVFGPTGKSDGTAGNVTVSWKNFQWPVPSVAVVKSSSFSQGGDAATGAGDILT